MATRCLVSRLHLGRFAGRGCGARLRQPPSLFDARAAVSLRLQSSSAAATSSRAAAATATDTDTDDKALCAADEWCAFYINLARRADRRTRLRELLVATNRQLWQRLQRIDAVDGQQLRLCEDAPFAEVVSSHALESARLASSRGAFTIVHDSGGRLVHFDNHLTPGGIACAMSHRRALQALVDHPSAKWALILEDDICAALPGAHEAIQRMVASLPSDWDALFLGYHDNGSSPHPVAVVANSGSSHEPLSSAGDVGAVPADVLLRRQTEPVFGLFAWVVRREAAEQLLQHAFPISGQVDHALSWWLVWNRGRAYSVEPNQMIFFSHKSEVALDSDIQTMATVDAVLAEHKTWEGYYNHVWSVDSVLEEYLARWSSNDSWRAGDLDVPGGLYDWEADLPPCEAPSPECGASGLLCFG
eukprot:TRINITY_DN59462_c0_g1_i1.p1 TRINITY_DN59462_c0_g1~~TRINITY_DN59462_c0_g1_i1.p1  ORF type:complete len:417 (+),score=86.67 TRINITY_DN59462_c0_g1_i1:119-1369(+)